MTHDAREPAAYAFGDYRIDRARGVLLHCNEPAPLTPKVFATLLELVQHRGTVVGKDQLMRAVWPDTVVDENNLNQNIMALRRALQDPRGANNYIQTVPGRGYRFVAEVDVIDTVPAPAGKAEPVRIAVLPFTNLSADPEREYLVEGLTEETIAALGQVDPQHIGVISRTTAMEYRQASDSVGRIGRELQVQYVIEGSLRAEGERLRVTAKLVRTGDALQVWSASFDSEPLSLLEFQRELATAIATQVQLRLRPERIEALRRRHSSNPEAFDAYLRGRHFWHQLTPATTRRALEFYADATRIDPNYALAWSGIADALGARPITGDAPTLEVLPAATHATEQAIRSQPGIAEVQASVGFRKFWLEWDWPGADAAFRRAVELDPHYSFSYRMLGILYSHVGRTEQSLAAMRRARELDPLLPVHHALSAQAAFAGRQFQLAAQFARQALAIDPAFWIGHWQLAQASLELGEPEAALQALEDAGRTSGGNSKVVALRGYVQARLGRIDEAQRTLDTLAGLARDRYVPPVAIALIQLGLGDMPAVIAQLDDAFAKRDVHLMFLPIDPKWEEARRDRRISGILKRCRFTLDR